MRLRPAFRPILVLAVIAAALAVPCAQALAQRGNPRLEYGGRTIDAMVADYMAATGVPGVTLAIVQAPYIPRVSGYGLADTGRQLLAGSSTLFDLGRMAEAYTAVAVMQMVEAGRLGLEDPVGKHVDGLPEKWRQITLRRLLAHQSGLPDYSRASAYEPSRDYSPLELLGLASGRPLNFTPGLNVADSATDYLLLALAVQSASGERFQDFVRVNQFVRLGLAHTVFADSADPDAAERVELAGNRHTRFLSDPRYINPLELATGYLERDGQAVPAAPARMSAVLGSGGIWASAMDVSLWDIGLAGNILVKDPALRAVLYHPAVLADGRPVPVMGAWRFPGRQGLMYVTGSASGQSAFLSRFTDSSELVCVTLLGNLEGVDFTGLARRIAGAYDPRLGPPQRDAMAVQQSPYPAAAALDRFEDALTDLGAVIAPGARREGKDRAGADNARGSQVSDSPGPVRAASDPLRSGKPAVGAAPPGPDWSRALKLDFRIPLADLSPEGRPKAAAGTASRLETGRAMAWEENGQTWLGYGLPGQTVQANRAGGKPDSDERMKTLRRVLDRALLKAVTPY